MATRSKRYIKAAANVEKSKLYGIKDALKILKESSQVKFDETVEMVFRIGVDPKKSDQMVRGVVTLPHGTGKTAKVLVMTGESKRKEAEEAGADHIGGDELIEKILGGWMDFDVVVATPDMMKKMAKLGKVLGPKGLMPSPKAGTVTDDIGKGVKEIKKGKIEFKVDKSGNLHVAIGKISFNQDSLYENAVAVTDALMKVKPRTLKGAYILKVGVSSTMGPGIKVTQDSLNL